jgi:hypothetical protein
VQADLIAASRHQYLALFDPAAIPADTPVDPDMRAQDPTLMTRAAMTRLAAAGDALILHIPTEDCEAAIRVFVGEEPPAEIRRKAHAVLTGAGLRVPSGRLRADGLEFMARPGEVREHSLAEEAAVPPGRYLVEVLNLQGWKARNRLAEGRRGLGALDRFVHRLVTSYTWLGILMIPANVLLAPMVVLWFYRSRGWAGGFAAIGTIVALDALIFGSFWLLQAAQRRFGILSRVSEADAAFDRAHPDVLVVLSQAFASKSFQGDNPGGREPPPAPTPAFAKIRFVG